MESLDLIDRLPASVELAAGSGKTWTLADTVRRIAAEGGRALVLTHTVAGVHAMKAKLREFEVNRTNYHVATLTSFAVEFVSSYTVLADFEVPPTVDLTRSKEYIEGAIRVLQNKHIQSVLKVSYTHVLVDEYQDCSKDQHSLVLTIKKAIPQAAVFGDRLQGIFGFSDPIVDWNHDVEEVFPAYVAEQIPWRWRGHNEELGEWLLDLRPQLYPGSRVDFNRNLPRGVSFKTKTPQRFELRNSASGIPHNESVVVIAAPYPAAPRGLAKLLAGYSVMEEMAGSFMVERLQELSCLRPDEFPIWLAETTKKCFGRISKLKFDKTVLNRLSKGKQVNDLRRPGLEGTLAAFDRLRTSPNFSSLAIAMTEIRASRELALHSREAWRDLIAVIERAAHEPGISLTDDLARVRERTRHGGRREHRRVVSRTLLVKRFRIRPRYYLGY